MIREHNRNRWILTAAFLALPAATPVGAQRLPATPPLPAGHWAHDALERLAGAGLTHGVWTPGLRPIPEAVAGAALDSAAARSELVASPLAPFARAVAMRYREELGWPDPKPLSSPWVTLGAGRSHEALSATLDARLQVAPHRRVSFMVTPRVGITANEGLSGGVTAVSAMAAFGVFQVGVARAGWRLGPGGSDGMLLNETVPIDALVLQTAGPDRLPGILNWLGPVEAAIALSRIRGVTVDSTPFLDPWVDTPGTLDVGARDPWMIAARLALSPHPRLRLGVNRLITGYTSWKGEAMGAMDAFHIAVGELTVFDDQKASLEAAVRLSPFRFPITPYVELGFEDAAGALYEDPGLLFGLHLPRLPRLPYSSARWEYIAFGEGACYASGCEPRTRNWFWHPLSNRLHAAPDGRLLGHPLGGYGKEHRVQLASWFSGAGVQASLTGILRERHPQNLRFDGSNGRLYEGRFTLDWRLAEDWSLGVKGSTEAPRSFVVFMTARGLGREH